VSTYTFAIAGGGALSAADQNPITDGWFRSRRASLTVEAAATFMSEASHGSPPVLATIPIYRSISQPARIMMPLRSARS